MHREFRELLEKAIGESDFIIAVNIDIRGFSTFSMTVDSAETAIFIKKVYKKLIDEHFPNASFIKPTGDGLLIIIPYSEENLMKVVQTTITKCFTVLQEFGTFCLNDPMINYKVPQKVGIGLSRGAACRLVSEGKIIDYSGKVINLASRLMDLARPSGIVFDGSFGIDILQDEVIKLFSEDNVYIRGIAEREPIEIYYTKENTNIMQINKQPFGEIKWKSVKETTTLKDIKLSESFVYEIPSVPIDEEEIKLKVTFPKVVRGKKHEKFISFISFEKIEYFLEKGEPRLRVNYKELAKQLMGIGIKNNWEILLEIIYPVKA